MCILSYVCVYGRRVCQWQTSRRGHALCWLRHSLYVLGGADRLGSTASVEAYTPATGACSVLGDLTHCRLLDSRGCFTNLV